MLKSQTCWKEKAEQKLSLLMQVGCVAFLFAGLFGCGSSSNNDQGVSFTASGYEDVDEGGKRTPVGGYYSWISLDNFLFEGLDLNTNIVVQNRLRNQFIRLVRIDCDYDIQGSSISIPSDSSSLSGIVEPTTRDIGEPIETASNLSAPFSLVSPNLYGFLNNNLSRLPELPFRMDVACSATGVTQTGSTMTTNPVYIWVQFFDIAECPSCDGPVANPGDGGTIPEASTVTSDSVTDSTSSEQAPNHTQPTVSPSTPTPGPTP